MRLLLNPFFLYSLVWGGILFLYSLRISDLLLPHNGHFYFYFFLNLVSFFFGWLFIVFARGGRLLGTGFSVCSYIYVFDSFYARRMSLLTMVPCFVYLAGVYVSGNIPFLSLLGFGPYVSYVDFGIPVIHGFANSIVIFSSVYFFSRFLLYRRFKDLLFVLLLISIPVLLVSRQFFISIVVQFFFVFLVFFRVGFLGFIISFFLALVLIVLFGFLGDARSGDYAIFNLAELNIDYPDYLPSGFIWFYVYMVSPLNNVIYNINIEPIYFPVNLLSSIIPSLFRKMLFVDEDFGVDRWQLVNETLNVSSFHQPIILDLGLYLSQIVFFLISVISFYVFSKALRDVRYMFCLVVLLHGISLSFFAGLMFHLVFIFQAILPFIIFKKNNLLY